MLPSLSTSDNKDFIVFYVRHDPPPCISDAKAAAIDGEFCAVNKTPPRFPSAPNVQAAIVDPVPSLSNYGIVFFRVGPLASLDE
jgi:hypothetical protein